MFWRRKKGEEEDPKSPVKDPICGMPVDPDNAYRTEIGGETYYFCGAGCKAAFKKANIKDHVPFKTRKTSGGGGCH